MTPERWERIQELYHSARAQPEGDRTRFLKDACDGDTSLQREVQALLDQPVSTRGFVDFLGGPAPAHLKHAADADLTGRRVGTYQVLSLLGTGGMGEVYRAHDAKLGRDVAIKVLPAMFTADAERLARFDSEARMLAALNHPNIGAIYGLEDTDRVPALVLELVEGDTLADRLRAGPIPTHNALVIARQIAYALDAAHRKGIVHRDLKPANIKITPDDVVKVLDFGLAKAVAASEGPPAQDQSQSPTTAIGATRAGVILGTVAYMSPEQARGLPVDTRTDIWAFGCVLYEMLAGRPPFIGQTIAETLTAVLERDPDWKALPSSTPSRIRDLLRRCLRRDLALRLQNIAEARDTIEQVQRGWNRWRVAALAATAAVAVTTGVALWWGEPTRPPDRSEWVQLTKLSDSAIHPALSPDGRMVSFVRGPSNPIVPFAPGQVYVKALPDGEPVQLTNDKVPKMSPSFSPDGTRIAYTAVDAEFGWSTWTVPVVGGPPQLTWRNASGLMWTGSGRLLFSEMKKNPHMAIVSAAENGADRRDLYVPAHVQGMAHLSYASPDRQSVLLAEMDQNHVWMPCRVVPMNGSSPGRPVGPAGAGCTFGAWSRDGRWIYLTSNAGGANHIWRQRYPDGQPEQITSGPTEEEGIAISQDGRSLVTAVALRGTSLWIHDENDERQVSLEGSAVDAKFTPDGTRLVYKVVSSLGSYPLPGELRIADVSTQRSASLTPGVKAIDYDISPDGQHVVIETADRDSTSRLWIARIDGGLPPQPIGNIEGHQPRFGPHGDIFFRRAEGAATFVYRVRADGTAARKVIDQPIPLLGDVSPDARFILGWTTLPGSDASDVQFFPIDGGPPIASGGWWNWSPGGRSASISAANGTWSYLAPLQRGEPFSRMPVGGLHSEKDISQLPGARKVTARIVPGPSPDVYAFYRTTTQRNLYRIPIR
jgi:serine/threonine protein kinase/Tol biopolymer transport system component